MSRLLAHCAVQALLLHETFLEMDEAITIDEGCTASVLLLQRTGVVAASSSCSSSSSSAGAPGASWVLQTANVGDSSAVLVDTAG